MGAKSNHNYNGAVHAADNSGSGSLVVEGAASRPTKPGSIDWTDGTGMLVEEIECGPAVLALAQAGTTPVMAPVAGQKVAGGVVTLTGTNPVAIATGLDAVESVQFTLLSTTSPGLDPADFTADFANVLGNNVAAGQVNLYAWKYTSNANPTLIASTNASAKVAWLAIGT